LVVAVRGAHRKAQLDEEPHDLRDTQARGAGAFSGCMSERSFSRFRERDFIRPLAPRTAEQHPRAEAEGRRRPASQPSRRPTETPPDVNRGADVEDVLLGRAAAMGAEWAPVVIGGATATGPGGGAANAFRPKKLNADDGGSLLGGEGHKLGKIFHEAFAGAVLKKARGRRRRADRWRGGANRRPRVEGALELGGAAFAISVNAGAPPDRACPAR